jgi:surface polysaccharide O-acyltransferase-like enzyme
MLKENKSMKRNYSIDTLRTVATLLVILVHASSEYINTGRMSLTFDTSFWVGNIISSFSRICVPLFVLISGMFLLGKKETFKQSYQKRASRILIPLISWTLIYILYRASLSFFTDKSINTDALLNSVVSGKPFYHMWYLYMIIGLYLITPVINNMIPKLSRHMLWAAALLLLFIGVLNSSFNISFYNKVTFMLWFINYLGYFILGYLIKDYKKNFSFLTLSATYIISSILIAILTVYTITFYDNLYFHRYLTPFVIIGSLSVYRLFLQLNLKENILSKISHLTFGIYLIHAGVLHVFNSGLQLLESDILSNPIIGIPIKFIVSLFISTVAVWMLSKVKYVRKII